MQYLTEYE